jgi:hypothetical protein
MRLAGLLLFLTSLAFAAVEGTVANQTTGKPQAGAVVTLIRLGEGMDTTGTVRTGADGRFRFETELQPNTPYLLQALYEGVTYNRMLQPGAPPTSVTLDVYNASATVPDAKVTNHMILIEPSGSELVVNETILFTNNAKVTYSDPQGTLKFYVPPDAPAPPRVMVQAPQGLPVQRPAEKGQAAGTYSVNYPMKPGETRVDIAYTMPAASPARFEGKILHAGPVRIIAPQGVKFESPALTDLGPEPRTQATVYQLKGNEFAINIQGTGSLRASAGSSADGEEAATPGIEQIKPRIYEKLHLLLPLSLGMLLVGFVLLYRSDWTARKTK